jgi:uncharacterized protein YecE (DUF72 family)
VADDIDGRAVVTIRVGTSGWQYADWRGLFYPPKLAQRNWLTHYATTFDTVEVNATFYRLPSQSAVQKWADTLPDGFVMAVKASRYLTHVKRLVEPDEPVARLMDRISPLRQRGALGPVLVQLPPHFPVAAERLDQTLRAFDRRVPIAVELRDASWFNDEVKSVLTTHNAALVWADRDGRSVGPLWTTATWRYLRLHHGRSGWGYDRADLRRWAHRMGEVEDGYVYANNDPGAAAVQDASRIRDLLHSRRRSEQFIPAP